MTRPAQPDFLIIGAPKAGTTALHAALAGHPDVFISDPKEPKYWLCDGAPPPAWGGPGDAHSQQEWIWRADEYATLFDGVGGPHKTRGESTPFYLWSRGAHRRIGEALPEVRLIAVVRDPIDRAYSNWMHLWSDGLEPERGLRGRVRPPGPAGGGRAGRRSGATASSVCTASSSRTSSTTSTAERVLVLRYRDMIDDPRTAVDRACRFLGIRAGPGRRPPAGQLTQLRPAGLAVPGVRPGDPHRRAAGAVRSASGVAPGQRAAGRPD